MLTLHSLPHEVVLSIVEWTAYFTIQHHHEQERLEREREHEEHHQQHHHAHGFGLGDAMGAANGPGGPFGFPIGNDDGNLNDGGIGDNAFMQNLFGFLNGGIPANPVPVPPEPTAAPLAGTDGNETDEEMPALEPLGIPLGVPLQNPVASTSAQATVEADSDEEMQPLESVFSPAASSADSPATATTSETFPAQHLTNEVVYVPLTLDLEAGQHEEGHDLDNPDDATPPQSTASLGGVFESELHNAPQGPHTYTQEDLEEMPDMAEAPQAPAGAAAESDWSTDEEGDSDDVNVANQAGEATAETDDDNVGVSEDEGTDAEEDCAKADVAYPDGLPSCPYLPLALVNRSFLNAARALLYGRHVHLVDVYQAHLFHRTLISPQISIYEDEPDADDEEARQQQQLSYLVRDVAFDTRSLVSLGRGGGQLFIQILKECPRLEHVMYTTDFMKSAQKPLEAALAGCDRMKRIQLRGGDRPAKDLIWNMRNLAPLLAKWKNLESLQILWLKHSINGPLLAPPKTRLVKLSLAYPDITDNDLMYLLKGSKDSLKQLDLHLPTTKLTRAGVARTIIEYGSSLISLQIDVTSLWHPQTQSAPPAEAAAVTEEKAAKSRYLVDGLIGHMPILEELKLSGSLASTILFARLPKSISVLAFEDNHAIDMRKVVTLLKKKKTFTNGKRKKLVPLVALKLRCFTASRSDGAMLAEDLMNELDKLLEKRKACVHWSYHSPMAVWRPDGTIPAAPVALGMMGGLLAAAAGAGPMPMPPMPFDFDFAGMGPIMM